MFQITLLMMFRLFILPLSIFAMLCRLLLIPCHAFMLTLIFDADVYDAAAYDAYATI